MVNIETALLFSALCGLLSIFFKRNFLNSLVALHQIIFALIGIAILQNYLQPILISSYILVLAGIFSTTIFGYTIAIMLIKRRSTLHVNELGELRD